MNTSAGALGEAAIRIDYVLTQNLKVRRLTPGLSDIAIREGLVKRRTQENF
jgi:hypothetical protein